MWEYAMSGREILNPCASLRCEVGPAEALVEGSSGSSWTTRDKRRLQGWPDAGPPDNVIVLASSQIGDWEAKVECRPRQHGEQAGLYAYADETSWVKFVVERVWHIQRTPVRPLTLGSLLIEVVPSETHEDFSITFRACQTELKGSRAVS